MTVYDFHYNYNCFAINNIIDLSLIIIIATILNLQHYVINAVSYASLIKFNSREQSRGLPIAMSM